MESAKKQAVGAVTVVMLMVVLQLMTAPSAMALAHKPHSSHILVSKLGMRRLLFCTQPLGTSCTSVTQCPQGVLVACINGKCMACDL
ncbi:hypothetical protein SEVIR_2G030150v4 [Setaria viridis]|uniref:Uncharacterized protein n=1 Tax=Setaria viridis TaxID=4556 RepID=A0A4U6VNR4_SETVI|nr:hypothetical protein SEVIR_2G030150v2 [Setaria viridis]TKW30345.1 hypothetical protein SEVIR_2G030150v2 [Setaria viridis]